MTAVVLHTWQARDEFADWLRNGLVDWHSSELKGTAFQPEWIPLEPDAHDLPDIVAELEELFRKYPAKTQENICRPGLALALESLRNESDSVFYDLIDLAARLGSHECCRAIADLAVYSAPMKGSQFFEKAAHFFYALPPSFAGENLREALGRLLTSEVDAHQSALAWPWLIARAGMLDEAWPARCLRENGQRIEQAFAYLQRGAAGEAKAMRALDMIVKPLGIGQRMAFTVEAEKSDLPTLHAWSIGQFSLNRQRDGLVEGGRPVIVRTAAEAKDANAIRTYKLRKFGGSAPTSTAPPNLLQDAAAFATRPIGP